MTVFLWDHLAQGRKVQKSWHLGSGTGIPEARPLETLYRGTKQGRLHLASLTLVPRVKLKSSRGRVFPWGPGWRFPYHLPFPSQRNEMCRRVDKIPSLPLEIKYRDGGLKRGLQARPENPELWGLRRGPCRHRPSGFTKDEAMRAPQGALVEGCRETESPSSGLRGDFPEWPSGGSFDGRDRPEQRPGGVFVFLWVHLCHLWRRACEGGGQLRCHLVMRNLSASGSILTFRLVVGLLQELTSLAGPPQALAALRPAPCFFQSPQPWPCSGTGSPQSTLSLPSCTCSLIRATSSRQPPDFSSHTAASRDCWAASLPSPPDCGTFPVTCGPLGQHWWASGRWSPLPSLKLEPGSKALCLPGPWLPLPCLLFWRWTHPSEILASSTPQAPSLPALRLSFTGYLGALGLPDPTPWPPRTALGGGGPWGTQEVMPNWPSWPLGVRRNWTPNASQEPSFEEEGPGAGDDLGQDLGGRPVAQQGSVAVGRGAF
ncbi:Hypothetical predicted protein [Marmota monax]|uniref:Uncharacterized protein n=1 Tax=Marmota monax TaxID=9995 RepID=A0A5E4A4E4_MARMO|nr:Hypothetical predicted protein [Marmota monax]